MPQKPKGHWYKSTSGWHDDLRENGTERAEKGRRGRRRDTEVQVAPRLPLATYANAGKSIYLYLFIAFKCFPRNGAPSWNARARARADVAGCRRGPPAKASRSRSLRATRSVGSQDRPPSLRLIQIEDAGLGAGQSSRLGIAGRFEISRCGTRTLG